MRAKQLVLPTAAPPDKVNLNQNHRMFGVGRDPCGSSSPNPLLKQCHLEQAAYDLVQAGLEYLQRSCKAYRKTAVYLSVFFYPQIMHSEWQDSFLENAGRSTAGRTEPVTRLHSPWGGDG